MADAPDTKRGLYGQRPSKSADAARRKQIAADLAMTPEERIKKALSLRELSVALGFKESPKRGKR